MTPVVIFLILGALAPMFQSVIGTFMPLQYFPDFGLLLVAGLGLYWRSSHGGFALAAAIGFITDVLSGSLLGQHILLRMFAFGVARVASQQFNLRGPLSQVVLLVVVTVGNALGTAALTTFFMASHGWDSGSLAGLTPHALVNGIAAPLAMAVVARIAVGFGDVEPGQSLLPGRLRKRLS
jgi:cell shape-determining protein MreD